MSTPTKWYTWRQGNPGGGFGGPALIVSIESTSLGVASARLEEVRSQNVCLYCECCGGRWEDAEVGDVPTVYGEPIDEAKLLAAHQDFQRSFYREAGALWAKYPLNGDPYFLAKTEAQS